MRNFEIIDRRFHAYVLGNAPLERLATGFRWTEGPVWFEDLKCLLFSDIPNNRVLRWVDGGGVSVFQHPSGHANGHTRDLLGRLVTCEHSGRRVTRTEIDGSVSVLADAFQGRPLNSPNDVVVSSDGSVWFTDPHYGIACDYEGGRAVQEQPGAVYRIDGDGQLRQVLDGFVCPNGLCFSPDETRLYVAETGAMGDPDADRHVRAYAVGSDWSLSAPELFYKAEAGMVDGFRCDEDGNVWAGAGDGVHCIAPDGTLLGKIRVPEVVANVCFGEHARHRLFICGTTSLYAVYLNRRGAIRPGSAQTRTPRR